MMMNNTVIKICAISLLCGIFFSACSTTRNLPEGETLYIGVDKMEVVNADDSETGVTALEEVEAALSYPPNNAILGSNSLRWPLPIGLWVYNNFEKYKDKKGVGRWIYDHMAANPVLMSNVNPSTRVKIATNLLRDYGFFNGRVGYEEIAQKNPKKTKVSYRIDMGNPY